MYKVAIVDDEPGALSVLTKMVNDFFDFEVVGQYSSAEGLIESLAQTKPHVLFLDIHLGDKSGIDIARELYHNRCDARIIFVSAYDKYAIQAFEYNIIDYLLKPVSRDRLQKCIQKIEKSFIPGTGEQKLKPDVLPKTESSMIKLNTQNGFLLIDPLDIVFLEADHVYTNIRMADQSSHFLAQNIGRILTIINNQNFLRISRSHVINARFLREVNRTHRKCLMFDGVKEFELTITKTGLKSMDGFFE